MAKAELESELDLARTIQALLPEFRAGAAYLRSAEPVHPAIRRVIGNVSGLPLANRDAAFCSLANKAATSHDAISVLVRAGHGDDALSLARVLLENAILMKSMLLDPVFRLDSYCLSSTLFRRTWKENVDSHFDDNPSLIADAQDSLDNGVSEVAAFFGRRRTEWIRGLDQSGDAKALTVKRLFQELKDGGPEAAAFLYDVPYFDLSSYIHSALPSVTRFAGPLVRGGFFDVSVSPSSNRAALAMRIANISILTALEALAHYAGLTELEAKTVGVMRSLQSDADQAVTGGAALEPTPETTTPTLALP